MVRSAASGGGPDRGLIGHAADLPPLAAAADGIKPNPPQIHGRVAGAETSHDPCNHAA
jgi:hypothetical protein